MITECLRPMLVGVLCMLGLPGCQQAVVDDDIDSGRLILGDHPLVEKIWDVRAGRFVESQQLFAALDGVDYLLLGELHDNRQHHRHQAAIIAELARQKKTAAVYFEMIDQVQGEQLAQQPPQDLEQLLTRLEQSDSGWDYRQMYRPLFEQAMLAGFPIRAANLPRRQLIDLMRQQTPQIPPALDTLLKRYPLNAQQHQAMAREVVEAHCNMLPEQRTQPMILAQRLRDAQMASRLRAEPEAVRVLITGNGHARRDRGVPMFLAGEEMKILSVGFFEVAEGDVRAEDYSERWEGGLPFDYVWFTVRFDRADPCAALQRQLHESKSK